VRVIPGVYQVGALIWDHEMIRPYVSTTKRLLRVDSTTPNIGSTYGVFVPDLKWTVAQSSSGDERARREALVPQDTR